MSSLMANSLMLRCIQKVNAFHWASWYSIWILRILKRCSPSPWPNWTSVHLWNNRQKPCQSRWISPCCPQRCSWSWENCCQKIWPASSWQSIHSWYIWQTLQLEIKENQGFTTDWENAITYMFEKDLSNKYQKALQETEIINELRSEKLTLFS